MLFKLEACIRTGENKTAVTSNLCQWNRSRCCAEPALLQNIDFKRPKKGQLPSKDRAVQNPVEHYSVNPSTSRKTLSDNKIMELRSIMPQAAWFTSIDENTSLVQTGNEEDTATADENEENLVPEPITSLFDYTAVNLDGESLKELCLNQYKCYVSSYSSESYSILSEIIQTQNLSKTWKLHRAGRITASNFHEVMHFKYENSNSSLLQRAHAV